MNERSLYQSMGTSVPDNYERHFVPVIGGPASKGLLAAAQLKPGERVLDVACGTGVVARAAADAVGATGTVAGLDVNPEMLATARKQLPYLEGWTPPARIAAPHRCFNACRHLL